MLVLEPTLAPGAVDALVAAGDVAAAILPLPAKPDAATLSAVKQIVAKLQAGGIAVLIAGPADLVAATGADGLHVEEPAAVPALVKRLKPASIVGAGALATRHEAMETGESGADYVQFGRLDPSPEEAERAADLIAWWAELFEVPCVGVAADLAQVATLRDSGADFIALGARLLTETGAEGVAAADRLLRTEAA